MSSDRLKGCLELLKAANEVHAGVSFRVAYKVGLRTEMHEPPNDFLLVKRVNERMNVLEGRGKLVPKPVIHLCNASRFKEMVSRQKAVDGFPHHAKLPVAPQGSGILARTLHVKAMVDVKSAEEGFADGQSSRLGKMEEDALQFPLPCAKEIGFRRSPRKLQHPIPRGNGKIKHGVSHENGRRKVLLTKSNKGFRILQEFVTAGIFLKNCIPPEVESHLGLTSPLRMTKLTPGKGRL